DLSQARHHFWVILPSEIQPSQHQLEVDVETEIISALLERRDGARTVLRRIVARPKRAPLFAECGVDGPEDPVGFAVGRIALGGGFWRLERLARAILTGIESRELGPRTGRGPRERKRRLH